MFSLAYGIKEIRSRRQIKTNNHDIQFYTVDESGHWIFLIKWREVGELSAKGDLFASDLDTIMI